MKVQTALFKPRDYQQEIINKVNEHLLENDRCCVSLATGGGKTVVFSELVNSLSGKTLILVHREELVYQTSKTLNQNHCLILPKSKYNGSDIAVAMVQTLHNRLKKGQIKLNDFENLIIDECHRGDFMKIISKFEGKVIGLTATPNYEKTIYFYKCIKCGSIYDSGRKCCNVQNEKYKQYVPLSKYYKTLIEGIDINELIDRDFLVPDENFIYETDETMEVWNEKTGELTEESANFIYGSKEGIRFSIDVYNEVCKGKKTIIFNSNTLINKRLYDEMILQGINAKMYDSNNSNENRSDLINWFKTTPDAVLLNVHVFTTGFDATDVECIFLNKKTKSINLYLQMVGRGGRITDKIFKPKFKVIDIGNNNKTFGKWSSKRDWNEYFYNDKTIKVGKPKPASVRTCHKCEAIVASNSLVCEYCGAEKVYNGKTSGVLKRDGKMIIPTPDKIVSYCELKDLDCNDARKITMEYITEMFEETSYETFVKYHEDGTLFNRALNFLKPYYFSISRSNLKGNRIRKLTTFTDQLIKEIEKSYDNRSTNTTEDIHLVQ